MRAGEQEKSREPKGAAARAAMAEALRRHVMEAFQPGPEVRLAGLGEDSVPVGALALAAQTLA